jgi:8-oxo-dGTP pyrophosphatase MutT (NUDIX family)
MTKIISCGSVITKGGEFLIAKPNRNKTWNIPKGKMDGNETTHETAVRETLEECNIDITKNSYIRDLGEFKYLKGKNLYLYLVVLNYNPTDIKCNSTYVDEKTNIEYFEMIDFRWIKFDDYPKYFSYSLRATFDVVIPKAKHFLKIRKR